MDSRSHPSRFRATHSTPISLILSLSTHISLRPSVNSYLAPPLCQLTSLSLCLFLYFFTDVPGHITEFSFVLFSVTSPSSRFLTFLPLVYLLLRAVFLTMSTSPLPSVAPEPSFDTLQSMSVEQVCALTYATLKKIFLGAPDDWKAEHSNIPRRVYQLLGIVLSFREKIRMCNEHENPEQREANGRHQLEKLMS